MNYNLSKVLTSNDLNLIKKTLNDSLDANPRDNKKRKAILSNLNVNNLAFSQEELEVLFYDLRIQFNGQYKNKELKNNLELLNLAKRILGALRTQSDNSYFLNETMQLHIDCFEV